ncbi:MAG: hypothetical protein AB1485_04335 [Candidatus Thermoplasmatota archaeon]
MRLRYITLHERSVRSSLGSEPTEHELLLAARKLFNRLKRIKAVKAAVEKTGNIIFRLDLIGTPEVHFTIIMRNNKLSFSTERIAPDLAVGLHKKWFIELINQPNHPNPKQIFDNVQLRKGNVHQFKRFKSIWLECIC